MGKNIVFCADGTWNGPGESDTKPAERQWTNVFKIFLNLDGSDSPGTALFAEEQERELVVDGNLVQIAKYLHGVGDSENFIVQALGGGLGEGLIARIVRGYTFISRNYEAGDKIFVIGFSRGAYTARALAGLISAKGLLSPEIATEDDKNGAYRAASAVWYEWRCETLDSAPDLLDRFQEFAKDLPHFLFEPPPAASRIPPPPIEAVAVWDTVGALGIPQFDLQGKVVDAFRFADTKLSDNVKFGLHAISIDERRANFTPTLWDDRDGITQVLFPGAHADVGGGYITAESGLSDGALIWMTGKLKKLGVDFANTPFVKAASNPGGQGHTPWTEAPWIGLPSGPREFLPPPVLGLAQSVLDRIGVATLNPEYLPANLQHYLAGKVAAPAVVVVPLVDP
ncbi:MAG TPA: DUF2235 domain-containing protein [Stellaceae bacterium]|jgi:uncharacterized protein (DUF2235 family)|nr:DUF2235 domain-containing protein [Stellaceae bacterium]